MSIVTLLLLISVPDEEADLAQDMADARAKTHAQSGTWPASDEVSRAEQALARARWKRDRAEAEQAELDALERQRIELPPRRPKRVSFFAEPAVLRVGSLRGHTVGFVGVKLGLLIKERWQLGVASYGHVDPALPPRFGLVYGGVTLDYAAVSLRWFRLTFGALVGGGVYVLSSGAGAELASLFVFEPLASMEFRPTRWLGLGLEGGYRLTGVAPQASLQRQDLNGWSAGFRVRFGL